MELKSKTDMIISAYQDGQSLGKIAKSLGTYSTSIKRILEDNDIEIRPLARKKGKVYVENGEELLKWAKAQKRLVTKAELANIVGRKRLSPSYFKKYPELGQYVTTREQYSLQEYSTKLYTWLQKNDIPYKPGDRTVLHGLSIHALLLGDYANIGLLITEKAKCVSKKIHDDSLKRKLAKAKEVGLNLLLIDKSDLENPEIIKTMIDSKRGE